MEFCPKCGSLLVMKKTKFGCPRCDYTAKEKIVMEVKEKINENTSVAVINENNETLPITDFECLKCGNDKAYFWTRQMRSGDEPESKFFKCTKCKNVVRED
ncbi:MAG: transcription factor S [Candidatus Pacearchaeota archaeon]